MKNKNYTKEIEKLKNDIREEYKKNQIISRILDLEEEEVTPKKGFVKIGINTSIENKWFTQEDHLNEFGFLSSDIPRAELRNLIENLFKFKDRETFIKKNNLDELKKEIIQFKEDNTYILIEVKQFYEYFFKYANELQIKYDSSINQFTFLDMPVIKCLADELMGKIVILKRTCGKWIYGVEKNTSKESSSNIHLKISKKENNTNLEIFTLNKFKLEDKTKFKIISFK